MDPAYFQTFSTMESIVVETAVMRDPHVRWCERGEPKLPLLDYSLKLDTFFSVPIWATGLFS